MPAPASVAVAPGMVDCWTSVRSSTAKAHWSLGVGAPDDVAGLVLVAAGPGFRSDDSRNQWNANVQEMAAARDDVPDGQVEITEHVDALVIDRLGEITVPTITLVGERDKRFLASADVFDKYLDVRQRVTVPDAGHMLHAKQPAEVAGAVARLAALIDRPSS